MGGVVDRVVYIENGVTVHDSAVRGWGDAEYKTTELEESMSVFR